MQTCCPYCKGVLENIPQRKTKCPICSKDIYVRTDPYSKDKVLVSFDDSICIDTLKRMGIEESQFKDTNKLLQVKFNTTPKMADIVIGIFDELQLKAKKENDWNELSALYFIQADFLRILKRPYRGILYQSQLCKLKSMVSGHQRVEVRAELCNKCSDINRSILTIDEALKSPLIPPEGCDQLACINYLPVVESE